MSHSTTVTLDTVADDTRATTTTSADTRSTPGATAPTAPGDKGTTGDDAATPTATVTVREPDTGRRFDVVLRQREVDGVVSSCGAQPEAGLAWVAESVAKL